MLKAKRPTDQSAGKHRTPFWKTAHTPTVPPQVSEAETIKQPKGIPKQQQQQQVQPPAIIGSSRASQIVTTSSSNATYTRQNSTSASYNVVRSPIPSQIVHDARNAVSTTNPLPIPHSQQLLSSSTSAPVQFKHSSSIPKPEVSVPYSNPHVQQQHHHRTSVQSLNSINTASTSRSSFERISTENLPHSWGTASTAPSSMMPQSTESLTRIPVGHAGAMTEQLREGQYSNPNLLSKRFPLVESDKPTSSTSKTHGHDTQGEQASDALPLPNSEYESPARVRSLRRSKPNINVSSTSVRVATSTTGHQTPDLSLSEVPPTPEALIKSPKSRDHHRSHSDMLDVAYIRRTHVEHSRNDYHGRDAMLARVMQTSSSMASRQSPNPASTASTRSMSMQAPRVSSSSQSANPNMTKLKQTSIPRISTSGISTGSPMIEQTRPTLDSLQSPLKTSAETSWTAVRSPTMTSSAPTYSTLTSAVMSPQLSSVTSPRTLVSSSHHHTEVTPIQPSQHYYNLSSSVAGSVVGRSPIVESDYDSSPSTAVPNTPTSHTVRALFSSFTSRSHRNSTPHPLRSSLSNPPITSQEVDSPRVLPAHVLTPPPLPPQSTRPDAPQQSFTHPQSQQEMLNLVQQGGPPPYSATSPRHGTTADLRNLKSSGESRRESAAAAASGLRSPSPNSILRSYGLGAGNAPHTPLSEVQRALAGSPFQSPGGRTLMSDSEVTTVTTVSVTRSTVVMPAGQQVPYNPHMERRSSSSAAKRESSVVSTTRNTSQPQMSSPVPPRSSSPAPNGGLFGLFRPKSPRHPFPAPDRASSPAPPPLPSKTPPPRAATASPSRKFGFSIPINLRHKPKKSISGASVEAVIGGERLGMGGDSANASQGSLLQSRTPDPHYVPGHSEAARRLASTIGIETDTEVDGGDDDVDIEEALALKMMAVEQWKSSTEGTFAQSGKRRPRAGVSFELPASESERDETTMTAVSVAPNGGRFLRYARRPRQTQQFSDNESTVFV